MATSSSPPPPVACSLSAADLAARMDDMAALAADALADRTPVPAGQRLVFRGGDGVAAAIERFVAAESRCCPFLEFDLRVGDGGVELTITGPEEAGPIIAGLFAADPTP